MSGSMKVKAGTRLYSVVCDTEVIVVRAPSGEVTLSCGGHPMKLTERNELSPGGTAAAQTDPALARGTQLGKRYVAADSGLEVLCTRAGAGTLTLAESPLSVASSKPLPSSD
jgi:hypothetical protein